MLVAELVITSGRSLGSLVESRIARFPVSGEINRKVVHASALIDEIENRYSSLAVDIDYTDGLSMSFPGWRFNIRTSNTEPLLRLNVEADADLGLMEAKRDELLGLIKS